MYIFHAILSNLSKLNGFFWVCYSKALPRHSSTAKSFAFDMKGRERTTSRGESPKEGVHAVDLFKA